jgi:hypothetical protein
MFLKSLGTECLFEDFLLGTPLTPATIQVGHRTQQVLVIWICQSFGSFVIGRRSRRALPLGKKCCETREWRPPPTGPNVDRCADMTVNMWQVANSCLRPSVAPAPSYRLALSHFPCARIS